MEKMPFRDAQTVSDVQAVIAAARTETTTTSDWRKALPVLTGSVVTLRELRLADAPSLLPGEGSCGRGTVAAVGEGGASLHESPGSSTAISGSLREVTATASARSGDSLAAL